MLDPILPRAGLVQPDYAVALAGSAALRPAGGHVPFTHDADFDDVSFAPAIAPAVSADDDFARLDEGAAEAFIAPDQYEDPEVFIAPDQYEEDVEPAIAAAPAPAFAPARIEEADIVETAAGESAASDHPRMSDALPSLGSGAAHLATPAGKADVVGLTVEEEVEEAAPSATPADPWDDPLPAWEYSHNEWPLLVKDEKSSRTSRSKWPLVA
ncbi:MAG TPA: hypothetical protein VJZ91_13140, partial [Blastocatellia bacterium]|nr:hypothetical protein [Blastocatellia bacterium]